MSSEPQAGDTAIAVESVSHRFKSTVALDQVSLAMPVGSNTAIIGPDGVGKSTLLGLIAGARIVQSGQLRVLGGDLADRSHRDRIASRIAYMPQGLGKNLYPTLSVAENIDFFASLYATDPVGRRQRMRGLLKATGLDPFPDRPAGKLSGGMKQKLSLCCALVHDPDILILDEPTTGIDPLSRRQFWRLIDTIRTARPKLTLVVATAYMEEAERFDRLVVMDAGKVLASGGRRDVLKSAGAATVEAAFVRLRGGKALEGLVNAAAPAPVERSGELAIVARDLTCRFGDFTAVDAVSFEIARGEIFGFLGSNGCGKTTTMKMLTGLTPATSGFATLLGKPVDAGDIRTRRRIGYMSQSFSLYGELSIRGNLELHARLYGLPRREQKPRVEEVLKRFDLEGISSAFPGELPLGQRQRLQLAAACLHRPEVLILDEPTSGVDPEARDAFWVYLTELSRNEGVTIFISTHFMNEAERCDRISFMHAGKVLAVGTPAELREEGGGGTLEDAFVRILETQAGLKDTAGAELAVSTTEPDHDKSGNRAWLGWVTAFALREAREVLRDKIRLSFAFLAPLLLLIVFARGISFDIEALPYAVFDRDRSAESLALSVHFAGSRYFAERPAVYSDVDVDRRLQSGDTAVVVEIPPGFGRDFLQGRNPTLSLWLDGANPSRANTARGYVEGIVQSYIASVMRHEIGAAAAAQFSFEPRFLYNQDFRSVYAITPGVIMFLAVLVFAMITALGVVREKEIGSIVNLAVSPASTGSFLIGKALPYIVIGYVSFLSMVVLAVFGLGVPFKGSSLALFLGGFVYVASAAAFGILVSTFVRSQVAAILACAILSMMPALSFSGFLQPLSNLSPTAQIIGLGFPSSWFQQISIGVLAKGLPFEDHLGTILALAAFPAVYLFVAWLILRKQEV